MASRSGELSRSSGGHGPAYSLTSVTSRRDFSSQGGSRLGQTAESGELGADSGWHLVDTRHGRSGRSWTKSFKQLTKLLDDIYLTCEVDCSLTHVSTMVEYLEASAGDFAELHSQLESVVSPSGQKVAWEVRSCRRPSSRSPCIGTTTFAGGGGGRRSSSAATGAQGPFRAYAVAAGSAAAAAMAGTTATAAAAGASAPGGIPGPWQAVSALPPSSVARASALLGIRRATSCGGGPGLGSSAAAAGTPVGEGGSEGGGGRGAGGVSSTLSTGFRPSPSSGTEHIPETGGQGSTVAMSGAATDGNPWKGKMNWNELFTRQQRQSQQQPQQQPRPGSAQGSQQLGKGATAASAAAAGGGFRLGTAPPPPRLRTVAPGGGGGGNGSSPGGDLASRKGCFSPSGGPPSPLDALYHKMMSSPSRKLSPSEVRRASEERQARAEKARQAMVGEKLARLAQANQSRQTVKSMMEERAGAIAARVDSKIARSAELRQAHLAERVQKAVEETKKVAEVAFINQMLELDKKLALQEKLEEGETRRRLALEALQQRGKGAAAAVEEAQERRKLLEAERREQLADRQRRKMAAQAKLEEERRATAAAREAASRAQRAAAAQVAEARQRLRDVLSVRIEERLREAAARRAQHLELIKERAALGKDLYERRTMDGNTTSPRSPQSRYTRPPSPEVPSAGGGGHQLPPPPPPSLSRPVTPPVRHWQGGASAASAALITSAGAVVAASGTQLPCSPSGLHASASHTTFTTDGGPCPSPPLRSSDRSITLSADPRRRLKGMRRRACKTLARLEAARPDYTEPDHFQALLEGPDGRELVASWSQLVETALRDTAAVAADTAAAAGKAGRRKGDGGSKGSAAVSALGTAGGGAGSSSGGGAASLTGSAAAAAAASVKHLLQRVHTDLGGRSKGIALHAARPSGLLAALVELLTTPAAAAASHPPQTSVQLMELLALLVTSSANNTAWLLARCGGGALAGLVRCGMRALDRYNGLAADEVWEEPPEARYLAALLQTLACLCRTPFVDQPSLNAQQEELVAYVVACGLIHRSTELFSLFDQPAANDTAPIPGYVLQCLALLEAVTGGPRRRSPAGGLTCQKRWRPAAANGAAIALAFQETSMAGLPSLLTAVLLRAAPSCTPAEARPERLPPNFVEAAACVMRVLNNIARLDLVAAQSSLGASDLRVVFFHLVGFLLSYCTNQWPTGPGVESAICAALNAAAAGGSGGGSVAAAAAAGAASAAGGLASRSASSGGGARGSPAAAAAAGIAPPPPSPSTAPPVATGLVQLLNEVLQLIGFYGVLQPANQDVLLWGKSPTILQRLAEVPFPYFVEQQLYQVLMPTLLSVCYGSERACATLAQHMDLHLLRSYVLTMIRQFQSTSMPLAGDAECQSGLPYQGQLMEGEQGQGQEQGRGGAVGVTHGSVGLGESTSWPSSEDVSKPAGDAVVAGPLSPRRQLLQDLPASVPGMPSGGGGGGGSGGGGWTGGRSFGGGVQGAERTSQAGPAAPTGDDAFTLPSLTADRYSLPQRFPPELLPQVLAFLERQMPGATERAAESAESSLAAAVAAAAAAGRLTPASPQLSASPLAVLRSADGRGKKGAASKKPAAVEPDATDGAGGSGAQGPPAESATAGPTTVAIVPAQDAAGTLAEAPLEGNTPGKAAGAAGAGARPGAGTGAVDALAGAATVGAGGPEVLARETLQRPPSADAALSTPISKVGGGAVSDAPGGGAAAESPPPSSGAGGTGSSGRVGSSSGSFSYSHPFRRFLDAADVPVPFAVGGIRRQRLLEAAAAAAVADVGSGGCGSGSADANNCARSYVSELSFGGYLTPSMQGDSREGDPQSPGEDERMALDEFDLEQYELQRLDEQQHLDEQDVLMLDEPSMDSSIGGHCKASITQRSALTERKLGGSRGGTSSGEEDLESGSPPDLGAGLLAVKKAKGLADTGMGEFGPSSTARQMYDIPESTGIVMDAWWRRIGYEFGGVGDGSDSESPPAEGYIEEGAST